jgi:hypothetical protein
VNDPANFATDEFMRLPWMDRIMESIEFFPDTDAWRLGLDENYDSSDVILGVPHENLRFGTDFKPIPVQCIRTNPFRGTKPKPKPRTFPKCSTWNDSGNTLDTFQGHGLAVVQDFAVVRSGKS